MFFVKYFNFGNLVAAFLACLISVFLFDSTSFKKPFILAIFLIIVLIYLTKIAFNKKKGEKLIN